MGAEIAQGNLVDKASLRQACSGADKIIAAVQAIRGRDRETSEHVDLLGHRDLIDAANVADVQHFVYVSAYSFGPEYDSIPFFRFKRNVEQYLQTSRLKYTILRPTAFMESHAWGAIGRSILQEEQVTLLGQIMNPRNFVAVDDVVQFVLMALEDSKLIGRTVDIGGPEKLTSKDVVWVYEELTG